MLTLYWRNVNYLLEDKRSLLRASLKRMMPEGYMEKDTPMLVEFQKYFATSWEQQSLKKKKSSAHTFDVTGSMDPNPPPREDQVCMLGPFGRSYTEQ